MTSVQIWMIGEDEQAFIAAMVVWDGKEVQFSGDESVIEAVAEYTTSSEPTGTPEDGEAWVKSLLEDLNDTYMWAEEGPFPEEPQAAEDADEDADEEDED